MTGVCTSEKCVRKAKTKYECVKCDAIMKACSYHRNRVYEEMKEHLMSTHERAVEAVGRAYDKAVERAPIEEARLERIAASPTLQKIEMGKRWALVVGVAALVLTGLGFLTWLKMRGMR